jgi:hypothetical protein
MDEVDMLRSVRDDLSAPVGDGKARARQALLAGIAAGSGERRRMWLRIGTAVALATLLVVVGSPWRSRELSTANAAALLNDLASIAAAQPVTPASMAGYRYTKVESMYQNMMVFADGKTTVTLVQRIREMWIAADGSGRIREPGGINRDFGPRELSYEDMTRLPADPVALAAVIRERAARTKVPIDDEMFVVIGDLLRQQEAPPAVRSALYKVAAGIPGVELVGEARDHSGRPGVAVAKTSTYTGVRQRNVLIFDPGTSMLLGEEHVLLERVKWMDAEPPVVVGYAVYLESRIVDSLPRE